MSAAERIVVDTNVLSYCFRQRRLGKCYEQCLVGKITCVACVTLEELYFGARRGNWGDPRRRALEAFIQEYELLPVTVGIAKISAHIRAQRTRVGRPLDKTDAWIAATAISHGLPLLSHDKDFDGIEGLHLITLRDAEIDDLHGAAAASDDVSLKAAPMIFASFGSSVLH
jgi:predicted nucleic acid-binding protein